MKVNFSIISFALMSFLLVACRDDSVAVTVVGYNHTANRPIEQFYVNDAMGPDVMPQSGGGKDLCCFMLPREWRPGMHVEVKWTYGRMKESDEKLPAQAAIVEVPKYLKTGNIHVHFYDDDKIQLVVTTCDAEHPLYPLDEKLLLPWKANRSKAEFMKNEKPLRPGHVC